MRTLIFTAFLLFVCLAAAPQARAAATCTSLSINNVSLTGLDVISGVYPTAVATVSFTCKTTGSNAVYFTLSPGNGTLAQRYLKATLGGAAQHLNYQAYLDAGYTEVFGDGTNGTCVKRLSSTNNPDPNGNGSGGTFSIYLIANQSQDPYQDLEATGAAQYLDSLTLTVNTASTATCQVL